MLTPIGWVTPLKLSSRRRWAVSSIARQLSVRRDSRPSSMKMHCTGKVMKGLPWSMKTSGANVHHGPVPPLRWPKPNTLVSTSCAIGLPSQSAMREPTAGPPGVVAATNILSPRQAVMKPGQRGGAGGMSFSTTPARPSPSKALKCCSAAA